MLSRPIERDWVYVLTCRLCTIQPQLHTRAGHGMERALSFDTRGREHSPDNVQFLARAQVLLGSSSCVTLLGGILTDCQLPTATETRREIFCPCTPYWRYQTSLTNIDCFQHAQACSQSNQRDRDATFAFLHSTVAHAERLEHGFRQQQC